MELGLHRGKCCENHVKSRENVRKSGFGMQRVFPDGFSKQMFFESGKNLIDIAVIRGDKI
jgi:hypothetical protein